MKFPWKTNAERPVSEPLVKITDSNYDPISWYTIIVYSKKYNFFGELFYNSPIYEFEIESVSSDNGCLEIPWEDVDYWMSARELKKIMLNDLTNE